MKAGPELMKARIFEILEKEGIHVSINVLSKFLDTVIPKEEEILEFLGPIDDEENKVAFMLYILTEFKLLCLKQTLVSNKKPNFHYQAHSWGLDEILKVEYVSDTHKNQLLPQSLDIYLRGETLPLHLAGDYNQLENFATALYRQMLLSKKK